MGGRLQHARRRYRTVWISDVHLGFRGCGAGLLLDLLRSSECDRLYLVGDTIDMWAVKKRSIYEFKRPFSDGTTRVLLEPLDFIARRANPHPRACQTTRAP